MKKFVGLQTMLRLFLFILVFSVFTIQNAHAYLDPGSGSYILQLLIAGLFGMLFVFKFFWGKIIGFFKRLFSKNRDNNG